VGRRSLRFGPAEAARYPKGTPENPLSEADIERKFLSLAGAAIGRAQSEALLVEVNRTLDAETIAPLADSIGRCRITGRL
jgi:2-methylcitrate dehydratase PrpD